jgi:RNA polymerase sigma factor (sigma-70 family)
VADRPERLLRYLRRLAPPSQPASDARLLEQFVRCRDEDAFAALLARHGPMVLGACRRVLGDAHAAEDAAQATFLVLARRATAVRPPERLAAWLYGVARQVALKALRADARRRRREALGLRPLPHTSDPLAEVSARELLLILDAEVGRLPEVYRLPVLLCGLEGLSQEEAARRLGWTPGSLKGRLERGRARLHARLARRGLVLSAALAAAEVSRAGAAGASGRWCAPTAKAAALVAAGRPVAGVVSAEVITLWEGVLKAMLRARWIFTAALLALGLVGAGTGLFAFRPLAYAPQAGASAEQAGPAQAADEPDVYALLLIEGREPRLLPDAQRAEPAGDEAAYRRTQLALLRTRLVLQAALKRPEVARLEALKGKADPLGWLEKNLRAMYVDNTGILRVSVAEGSRPDRAALTNAVVAAYLEEVAGREGNQKLDRLNMLRELHARYEENVRDKRQVLHKLTEERGGRPALNQQFDREDLTGFRTELQRVRLESIRAQARLNYLKKAPGPEAREIVKLEQEVGVLAEQAKLLKAEIAPLARAVKERARTVSDPDLGLLRDEIAAGEQLGRKITAEAEALEIELRAAPRVRLLEEASAVRPKK